MPYFSQAVLSQLAFIQAHKLQAMADYKGIKAFTQGKDDFEALHKWLNRHPHLHQYMVLLSTMRSQAAQTG